MWTYFRGWKRKIGVAILGLAGLFVVAWVRGQSTFDEVCFVGRESYSAFSFGQKFERYLGVRVFHGQINKESPPKTHWISAANQLSPENIQEIRDAISGYKKSAQAAADGFWERQLFVFEIDGADTWWQVKIPYWSVTIPMTLLSAWCLLTKPRSKTTSQNAAAA
jgi:hypothetical protein